MKTIVFLIFISCLSFSAFSQTGLGFKIYQNTDIFQTRYADDIFSPVTTENNINFTRISLAVVLPSRKRFTHEIELLIPEVSKRVEKLQFPIQYEFRRGSKLEGDATSYSFRYEIYKLTEKPARINFMYGVGINPYYVNLEYTPISPNSYYTSLKLYGFALNATPGLHYKLNKLLSLELNVPIRVYNFQRAKYRMDNPILPLRQQRINDVNHLFFEPVYTIRLGLQYSLTK